MLSIWEYSIPIVQIIKINCPCLTEPCSKQDPANPHIESNCMPTYNELKERYYQITDSGENPFILEYDARILKEQLNHEVSIVGQEAPDGLGLPDVIDSRELYLGIYRPIADSVTAHYGHLGYAIPPICVAAANDGSLNATVRRMFDAGAVVLVNVGLDNILYQCFKVLANSCFADAPNYSRVQASIAIIKILTASAHGDPRKAPRLAVTEACYMMLAADMHKSSESFVIAHELAHLTEDDLCCMSPVEYEFRADKLGIVINNREFAERASRGPTGNERIRVAASAIAPILSFELLFMNRVFSSTSAGRTTLEYVQHPPELARRDALIRSCVEDGTWQKIGAVYEVMSNVLSSTYVDVLAHIESEHGFERSEITFTTSYTGALEASGIPEQSLSYKA